MEQTKQVLTVTEWKPNVDGQVSYLCPACGRATTGPKDKPHRHTCGAVVQIEAEPDKGD